MGHVEQGLENVFNSDRYKQFRLDLLNNKKRHDICSKCYISESLDVSSYRNMHNGCFEHKIEIVKNETRDDGYIDPKFTYFDVRFSNLCNMKCRTCHESLSSSWAAENKTFPIIKNSVPEDIDLFENHYDHIERVYFAGGEPLLMKQHFNTIKNLVEKGYSKNIVLEYNTNLSKLDYNNYDFVPLWKKFKQTRIMASIDHIFEKAEYVRHGTKWDKIESNMSTIKEQNFDLEIHCTVSIYNVLDLVDIVAYLLDNNFIENLKQFNFELLINPQSQSILSLPLELRIEASKNITNWISSVAASKNVKSNWERLAKSLLDPSQDTSLFLEFQRNTKKIDYKRKENFEKVFPKIFDFFETS